MTSGSRRAGGAPRPAARIGPAPRRDSRRPPGRPPGPGTGTLTPYADPVTGTLGWQLTTPDRYLARAAAAASPGSTVRPGGHGRWHARLPGPALAVTDITAAPGALRCRLAAAPATGMLTVPLPPPAAPHPGSELPGSGHLTIRQLQLTTRMGRTIRYLIPELTSP